MDEALGPSIEDYLRSIRRNGRNVVLAAIVGAVLLALLNVVTGGVSTRYRTVQQMTRVDESGLALAFGLPVDLVAQRSLAQESVRIREALRNELGPQLPSDAVVTANANEVANLLTVTALGDSAADAKAAADLTVKTIVEQRRAEVVDRLKTVDAFQAGRDANLRDRLAGLDKDLAAAPSEDRRRALELERLSVLDEQIAAQRLSIGAKQLLATTRGGISDAIVVVEPKGELSLGWITSAIVGLVLGAILALAVVVVRTFLDRRLRSRADIEQVVLASSILGVVPAGDSAARAAGYASVARLLPDGSADGHAYVLVGCTTAAAAVRSREELAPLAPTLTSATAVGRDGSVVGDLSVGDRVVLVASYGQTTRDDLAASVASAEAAQAVLAGVILVDVPARELGLALRSRSVMRSA